MTVTLRRVVRNLVVKEVPGTRPLINLEMVEGGAGRLVRDVELPVTKAAQNIAAEPGDVLFAKLRPNLRKSVLVATPVFASSEFLCLRPDTSRVDPRWLLYVTQSEPWIDHTRASSYGTKMPRTSWDEVSKFPLNPPSLDVQRQTADVLDDQVARMEEVGRLREEQIDARHAHRQSLLAEIFERDSARLPLRRVVSRWIDYRGATPEKTEYGVPLVTAKNIRDGVITFENAREFIADDDYGPWMRRGLPQVGDVLLTTEAPLGEVAVVDDDRVALAQRVILLRQSGEVLPRWLYWYLRSPQGQDELWLRSTGTTALGIKAERLREVPIPVPGITVQREALKPVEDLEQVNRALEAEMRAQIDLLRERKRSLITAAVMGEFDMSTASGRGVA